jgi:hypothetical protein
LTPTALSLTIASSVNSVLSTLSSPLATITANALALTKAALELRPPPTGTVPSITMFISLNLKLSPFFFLNSAIAPFNPLLK